ncbi:hypothetical protein [Thiohalorhabdus sp.]|uniref:hypothetical protein n=1 Tax=Thiohalorhabdus sp. TaxID=3094134 RepID=UPI002FC2B883
MRARGSRVGWLAGLLAAPALAMGAGTASVQNEGQTVDVAWESQSKARIDPQGRPGYLVMRDDKLYSVSTRGNRTMVMDLTAMAGMMGAMRGQMGGQGPSTSPGPEEAVEVESMGATGDSEVVAGIQGEVYEVRWRDKDGQLHTDQAVVSDNPVAVELAAVMEEVSRTFAEAMDKDHSGAVQSALSDRGLGILRYDDMHLTEIAEESPGAGAFELPAEPMDPSDMGGMPGVP